MLSESLQTDRGVDNKVSNIDFVISDYLCTKNDNNMANICSLVEIIESFDDSPSMILVGFQFINQLTGGLHAGSVITIGARTGMGKTSFALSLSINLTIKNNIPCLYLSAAHSSIMLANRLRTMIGNKVGKTRLYIDDTINMDFEVVEQSTIEAKEKYDVNVVIIDTLQCLRFPVSDLKSRQNHIAESMLSLKSLARRLNICIVVMSELNRNIDIRDGLDGKIPQLPDLRDSGSIEIVSDVVMFIHRYDYYNVFLDELGNDLRGKAEIIVAKNTYGKTGKCDMVFDSNNVCFMNPIIMKDNI